MVFLRDNPDGDHDFQADNDLKIFVLSRARDSRGRSAIVEALCELVPPGAHGGAGSEAATAGFPDLSAHAPVIHTITD